MTVADQTPDVIMFTDDRDRTNEFHHIVTTCATRRVRFIRAFIDVYRFCEILG